MGKNQIIIVLEIILFLSVVSCTRKPAETTCVLYGIVMSSNTDAPIKGALVVVQPGSQQVVTGDDGSFEITAANAPSSYRVLAQKEGFCVNAVSAQNVYPGERRYVPIFLKPIE